MEQTARMLHTQRIGIRFCDNVRIDIYQQHTEGNGNQKQWFKIVLNCQIQEDQRNQNHDVVSPCQIQECGLMQKI